MEGHTSAVLRIGDIDIADEKDQAFEVKHGNDITAPLVRISYGKLLTNRIDRYSIWPVAEVDLGKKKKLELKLNIYRKNSRLQRSR